AVFTGTPPAHNQQMPVLRFGSFRRSGSGWATSTGEGTFYTNQQALEGIKNTIQYCHSSNNPIAVLGFGWCWDMTWTNCPSGNEDPIHHVRWAGSSSDGPLGDLPWGLDGSDAILTGNSVCMDTYLAALQTYDSFSMSNGIITKPIATTGPVDGWYCGSNDNTKEGRLQREIKQQYIRDFIKKQEAISLFDYADILCWSSSNVLNQESWQDSHGQVRTYPQIHPEYEGEYNGGEGSCHINQAGCLRIGKALWWFLARMAGWNGLPDGGDTADVTPPTIPQAVTAVATSSKTVVVQWNAAHDDRAVAGYRIIRNGSICATTTKTIFSDAGLIPNTVYVYRITAFDAAGNESGQSLQVSVTTLEDKPADTVPPSIPSNLMATLIAPTIVSLTWNSSIDNIAVAGYTINRNGKSLANTTLKTYTDTGLSYATDYLYTVSAFDAAGNRSNPSTVCKIVTPKYVDTVPPSVPQGLTAKATADSHIQLQWSKSSDNIAVVSYTIIRNGTSIASTGLLSYLDIAVVPSTKYIYTVYAADSTGNKSPLSDSASAIITQGSDPAGLIVALSCNGDVLDRSGHNLHGVWQGQPRYAPGVDSLGIDFGPNAGKGVFIPHDSLLGSMDQLRIAIWARKKNANAESELIYKHLQYRIRITATQVAARVYTENSSVYLSPYIGMRIHDTLWHHYVLSYDGATATFAIDNVIVAREAASGRVRQPGYHYDLFLGKNNWGTTGDVIIDKVTIMSKTDEASVRFVHQQ
ncbi:MAG: hypothetical protein JW795_10160, partial [Chitinivibrionales bacterium]|nr:hypothetical protein [Chitinivibrionales bacterium]